MGSDDLKDDEKPQHRYDPNPESTPASDDLFEPGRYLLRVYQPGWQAPEAIELELA